MKLWLTMLSLLALSASANAFASDEKSGCTDCPCHHGKQEVRAPSSVDNPGEQAETIRGQRGQ